MSVSSLIKNSCSFVATPLVNIRDALWYPAALGREPHKKVDGEEEMFAKAYDKNPFPQLAKKKIEDFIRNSLKFDPSRLLLGTAPHFVNPATVSHSIKYEGIALLHLSQKVVTEIETNFTDEHRFLIAHEIGHLVADDTFIGLARKTSIASLASLAACTISFVTLSPVMSLTAAYLLSCGTARVIEFFTAKKIERQFEKTADLYAASQSLEIAKGGISVYRGEIRDNVKNRNKEICVVKCIARTIFSPEGNDRLDLSHPPLTERVAYLQTASKAV